MKPCFPFCLRRPRWLAALAGVFALTLAPTTLPSCDDHGTDTQVAGLEDVIFGTGTNDESLALILAATAVDGKGAGAVIDLPAAASAVSAATPAVFAWHAGPTARAWPARQWQFANPFAIAEAHAHGELVSGTAYYLVVSSANDPKLLRAFTKAKSFIPSAAAWTKLKEATGPLTAVVTTATFDAGKIASDGGPFSGKPVTFTIAP